MATAKKSTKKRVSPKKVKVVKLESFKVAKETTPFVTYKITEQTVYWTILLVLIFILALWVIHIQINISDILNQINAISI